MLRIAREDVFVFDFKRALACALVTHPTDQLAPLLTVWGENLNPQSVLQEYPRPQMMRSSYANLNGWWDYAIRPSQDDNLYATPTICEFPAKCDGRILVPFSPEALLSGVSRQLNPRETLWYRRSLAVDLKPRCRYLLHFEAVDFQCSCFVGERFVGSHRGGYAPFSFDVTEALWSCASDSREQNVKTSLTVAVSDPSEFGVQPRGKQRLERGSIWCTAQSGIWQTVWLEEVPELYVESLEVHADIDTGQLRVAAQVVNESQVDASYPLKVRVAGLHVGDEALACVPVSLEGEISHIPAKGTCRCEATGFVKAPRLWSPDAPFLYDLDVSIATDAVRTYCAFRLFSVEPDPAGRAQGKIICLNHEPFFMRGVLDQGYWPDGLLTAPSEEALAFDIWLARNLGFNTMRKHLKVESARWYFLCDAMGMVVWQDMVNGGAREYPALYTSYVPTMVPWAANHMSDCRNLSRFGAEGELMHRLWMEGTEEAVRHLRSFPCIAGWTVFNEAWGQFHARDMTAFLRRFDDTRLIDQTSGWCDQGGGDLISEHNYFRDIHVPRPRHLGDVRAPVISEFGGCAYHIPAHSSLERAYGYKMAQSADEFDAEVSQVIGEADALEPVGLAGYVYTQLTDVEEEVNGLATYDRRVVKTHLTD